MARTYAAHLAPEAERAMTWALGAAALIALAWLVLHRRARFGWLPSLGRPDERRAEGTLRTVRFPALDGTELEGWLFVPEGDGRAPIVLMAPGLGGTKDGFLEDFAWTFVRHGLAVLAFDYRGFGGSGGVPRHWVAPPRHREDYEAAIAFVQGSLANEVDASRLALWGSSFSGGTAIVTAAHRRDVRALVAQCPYLKTSPELAPRGLALARFVFWTTLDLVGVFPPIYVPLFGRTGEWAVAPSAECPSVTDFAGPLGHDFWRRLPKPPLGGWENRMLARGLATFDQTVPLDEVEKVLCPALFVAARADDMIPLRYVEEAHRRVPGSELVVVDGGHFDLYVGPSHAGAARHEAEFLARALGVHLGAAQVLPASFDVTGSSGARPSRRPGGT